MTNPQRFLNRLLVFLLLAAIVAGLLHDILWRSFVHNPGLNGLILAVLLIGIAYNIRRILTLKPAVRWIEAYRTGQPGISAQDVPPLIAPVTAALNTRDRRGRQATLTASIPYYTTVSGARAAAAAIAALAARPLEVRSLQAYFKRV